jgi:(p)ppGpp synthase/HD superfamily hydrolase
MAVPSVLNKITAHVGQQDREMIERAYEVAERAHDGQTRASGEPYIVHPAAVAGLLMQVTSDPVTLAAGWLHDVVEDTKVGLELIRQEFGPGVADLVLALTRPSTDFPGAAYAAQMHHASAQAQTVKLADIIDNCRSIRTRNPTGAERYLGDKRRLLGVLDRGDATLMAIAREIVG